MLLPLLGLLALAFIAQGPKTANKAQFLTYNSQIDSTVLAATKDNDLAPTEYRVRYIKEVIMPAGRTDVQEATPEQAPMALPRLGI